MAQLSNYTIYDSDHIISRLAKMLCLSYIHSNKPGKACKWMKIAKSSLENKESCEITGFIYQCEAWVYLYYSNLYPKRRQHYREKAFESYRLCREHMLEYSDTSEWLQFCSAWMLLDLAMLKLDIPLHFKQSLYPQLFDKKLRKCNIGYTAVTEAKTLIQTSKRGFQSNCLNIQVIPYSILLREIYLELRRVQVTNPTAKQTWFIKEPAKIIQIYEKGRKLMKENVSGSSISMMESRKYISDVFPYIAEIHDQIVEKKDRVTREKAAADYWYLGDDDFNLSQTPAEESSGEDTAGSEVQ